MRAGDFWCGRALRAKYARIDAARLPARNDWQQQIRRLAGVEVQGIAAAENCGRAVARVGVGERADTLHRIRRAGDAGVSAVIFLVPAADGETHAILWRNDNTGRPNLDIEFNRLARNEGPCLVVGVVGTVGQGLCGIELAV